MPLQVWPLPVKTHPLSVPCSHSFVNTQKAITHKTPLQPSQLTKKCSISTTSGIRDTRSKRRHVATCASVDEEPDWDKEMSIFKQRISRPNQLATLRELESKAQVGKVLYIKDSLAIVSGLNSDAPIGTKLTFLMGGTGVLLWHRSDKLAFVLVVGGAATVSVGEPVECKIKGVLQVVDEKAGPITRKDYEIFMSPAGENMFGQVLDYLGRPLGSAAQLQGAAASSNKMRPLLNQQVAMKQREQISEALYTGVRSVDVLTPIGRGASCLVVGPKGTGKSRLALDAILGQRGSGVRCVMALVDRSEQEIAEFVAALDAGGALAYTSVIICEPAAPLGEKYAALALACSIAERVRDEAGHALVLLDSLKPMSDVWDQLVGALAELGQDALRDGLVKKDSGDASAPKEDDSTLVDYEGMLVSGAAAQRRGFYSMLFMRAAKVARQNGGGSLTLMPLVPGRCATGSTKKVDMSKYKTLSPDQLAKIQAALEQRFKDEMQKGTVPGEVPTEVVEEFISICDGQIVLEPIAGSSMPYVANPKLSISRIGSRAYPKALESLAPQIRFELAQAEDARKFSVSSSGDRIMEKTDSYCRRMAVAIQQPQGQPTTLEELVVILLAVQRGHAEHVALESLSDWLQGAVKFAKVACAPALKEIAKTRILTAAAEKAVLDSLESYKAMLSQKVA